MTKCQCSDDSAYIELRLSPCPYDELGLSAFTSHGYHSALYQLPWRVTLHVAELSELLRGHVLVTRVLTRPVCRVEVEVVHHPKEIHLG